MLTLNLTVTLTCKSRLAPGIESVRRPRRAASVWVPPSGSHVDGSDVVVCVLTAVLLWLRYGSLMFMHKFVQDVMLMLVVG